MSRKRKRTSGPVKRARKRKRFERPQEVKFVDVESINDAFATTWATMEDATNDCVSGVAIGDTESSRDGRKYFIKSVHIRAVVHVVAAEANVNPRTDLRGRICLVWDTQTNGAQLTATDVMDGGQTDDTLAFRNLQHSKRFKVIWDKSWKLINFGQMAQGAINLFAIPATNTVIMQFHKVFPKPIPVVCTGTDATVTSISDNSLHIIGVANDTSALLNMQIRIRFLD